MIKPIKPQLFILNPPFFDESIESESLNENPCPSPFQALQIVAIRKLRHNQLQRLPHPGTMRGFGKHTDIEVSSVNVPIQILEA